MHTPSITVMAPVASGWTLLYVASKVHYAMAGLLGVAGGPAVPVTRYADFAPGEVAAAQWANAGMGVLAAGLLLLALRFPAGWNRWLLTAPLAMLFLLAAAGAVGMIVRDVLEGSGGTAFGAYCAVWAVLVGATAWIHHRSRARSGNAGTELVASSR